MSPETKLALFTAIDAAGVSYVEAGFPSASPQDFETVSAILATPHRSRVSVFARATVKDIDLAVEAMRDDPRAQLQLLLTGSEVHAEHKRRMSSAEIERETREAVQYARSLGIADIALGYEDSSRGSAEFLRRMMEAGVSAGGTTVVIADTVGQATPTLIGEMVAATRSWVGPEIRISVHCHNDLGLALANALGGVAAGADVVQGTFCGIGERTGNTAIEELATALYYKSGEYGACTGIDLLAARETCERVTAELGLVPWKHKPIVGRYAFSTAAGVHASGLENAPVTYEYVEPELFGRRREVVLNRASGRANLRMRLADAGLQCSGSQLDEMYQRFIADPEPYRFNETAALRELHSSVL